MRNSLPGWAMNILAAALCGLLVGLAFAAMLLLVARPARAQAAPAQVQTQCGPWPGLAAGLLARYGEAVLFEGVPAPGQPRMVVTANPDGTTWTAITIDPGGTACMRVAGGGVADGVRAAACGRGGLT